MSVVAAAAALGGVWLCTAFLRRAARSLGLLDPPPGTRTPERKVGRRPAAVVGGLGLVLVALPAALVVGELDGRALAALLAATLVGLVDDRLPTGLGPGSKVLAQLAVGLLVARAAGVTDAAGAARWVAVSLVAINAINTFDNSDGAAASLAALGLGVGGSVAAAGLLGFLPHNLRPGTDEERAPRAYLGDAGTHLVGAWIALTPAAWPALTVPLADLARVSVLRLGASQPPWVGDRRHLAQGLERAGWGVAARLTALLAASAPAVAAGATGGPGTLAAGVALSVVATLLLATRAA